MGLSFLTPALLAGIALVAVPIVLHLVMRQVPKHLLFPAVRFLQQREQANRRQLRLRHLILLLLRCAAIVLLATALARPSIKTSGGLGSQEAPVAAAMLFDTSPRMEYRDENRTRLEATQETARWLLTQLPPESDVAVLESEGEPGDFAVDLGAAEQAIGRLKTRATATPLSEAIERALPLLAKHDKPRKEIYIFTDLTRGAWPADESGHLKRLLEGAGDVGVYVIDAGVAEPRNFALGDVKVWPEVVAKSGQVRVETEAIRVGPDEDRAVAIYELDTKSGKPKPQMRDQKTVHWHAGEPQALDFTLANEAIGTHQGYIKILGEDNLAADDTRYFTFDVRPPFRVLVAAPKPADRYALFLTEALSPVAFRKTGRARFECETVPLDQLLDRNLDTYSAVCLLDPGPLEPAVWQRLASYVEQGGGLAIWLGHNAQPVEAFGDPAALAVLPGKLSAREHADGPNLFLAPRPEDLQHPLMARFRPLGGTVPWSSFPVWRHWKFASLPLPPGEGRGEGAAAKTSTGASPHPNPLPKGEGIGALPSAKSVTVIIPYNNGLPALLERTIGKGRVLTMTTPISDAASDPDSWNQLATGFKPWPFVMLTNEMLLYLVGSGEERLNYAVGERAVLRLDEGQQQLKWILSDAQGNDPQDLKPDPANRTLSIPPTAAAGNYLVQTGGTEGGVRRGYSANLHAAATELERITPETLAALLGPGRFQMAHNREEINRDVSVGRVGRELYPLLIFLVALALGVEHLLANRFYRQAELPKLRPQTAATFEPERASIP